MPNHAHSAGRSARHDARSARNGRTARISIVLTSLGERATLRASADRIAPFQERLGAELVIVSSASDVPSYDVAPDAQYVTAPASATHADMRALGLRAATGDIVVLRADTDVGDGTWLLPLQRVLDGAGEPSTPWVPAAESAVGEMRAAVGADVVSTPTSRDAEVMAKILREP